MDIRRSGGVPYATSSVTGSWLGAVAGPQSVVHKLFRSRAWGAERDERERMRTLLNYRRGVLRFPFFSSSADERLQHLQFKVLIVLCLSRT